MRETGHRTRIPGDGRRGADSTGTTAIPESLLPYHTALKQAEESGTLQ